MAQQQELSCIIAKITTWAKDYSASAISIESHKCHSKLYCAKKKKALCYPYPETSISHELRGISDRPHTVEKCIMDRQINIPDFPDVVEVTCAPGHK